MSTEDASEVLPCAGREESEVLAQAMPAGGQGGEVAGAVPGHLLQPPRRGRHGARTDQMASLECR